MARPIKEGMDYFPHDTDAVNDEKIEALRALYGNDGYAFYFILLERIYRANDAEIDVSDAEIIQILSKKVAVTPEKFMQILETALKWGCFDREEYEKRGVLTSNGIKKRAAVVLEKRASMREKYRKQRGSGVSASETGEETRKERDKVKKRKVKESKEKKSSTPPVVPPEAQQSTRNAKTNDDNDNIGLKKIYDAFSENIHPITPFEAETLGAWVDDGMEPDAIIWAIRQAVLQGKRTARYIDAIIRNLHTENITTAAGAEARERDRQQTIGDKPSTSRAREPTRLSPQEKERLAELNRQIKAMAEERDLNKSLEVPP